VASRLQNKGIVVKCPNHHGHCTANLAEDAVIGNETEYSRQCTNELNDTLKIANIITDGDSKSFNGLNNTQGKGATQLRDIRHLSNSMKRAVQNCTFSLSMFATCTHIGVDLAVYTTKTFVAHNNCFDDIWHVLFNFK
jgi:hypothetical protein